MVEYIKGLKINKLKHKNMSPFNPEMPSPPNEENEDKKIKPANLDEMPEWKKKAFEGIRDKTKEQGQENKEKIINITREEWRRYCDEAEIDNPDLKKWMEEKGIKFDSGEIWIEIDGEKLLMNTSREDFGTMNPRSAEILQKEKE